MLEKRLSRLFSILCFLSPYSQVGIRDLAREYEVDERTIYRDLEILRNAKMGIFCDENDKIRISRVGYQRIRSWMTS